MNISKRLLIFVPLLFSIVVIFVAYSIRSPFFPEKYYLKDLEYTTIYKGMSYNIKFEYIQEIEKVIYVNFIQNGKFFIGSYDLKTGKNTNLGSIDQMISSPVLYDENFNLYLTAPGKQIIYEVTIDGKVKKKEFLHKTIHNKEEFPEICTAIVKPDSADKIYLYGNSENVAFYKITPGVRGNDDNSDSNSFFVDSNDCAINYATSTNNYETVRLLTDPGMVHVNAAPMMLQTLMKFQTKYNWPDGGGGNTKIVYKNSYMEFTGDIQYSSSKRIVTNSGDYLLLFNDLISGPELVLIKN